MAEAATALWRSRPATLVRSPLSTARRRASPTSPAMAAGEIARPTAA
jgi:hypothetical protein